MALSNLHIDRNRLADLCRRYGIERLEIIGSFARGDARPESDIDVLVTFKPDARIGLEFVRLKEDLEALFGREVDLLTKASVENSPNKYFRRFALRRTEVIYENELTRLAEEYGSRDVSAHVVEEERERGIIASSPGSVRFYIPEDARWLNIRRQATGLGQYLTDAVRVVARENPRLQGVIDLVDFNATAAGQRIVPDEYLANLEDVLSRHRLVLWDVEPDILGRAYDYLLRKFAEGQGQSAGEFYTPRELAVLMARILEPQPGITLVINRKKKHPGEILLINASKLFAKGRPKNYLTDKHVEEIADLYHEWKAEEGVCAIIINEEAECSDYNLSPSRYVASNDHEEVLPLEDAVVLLREAEEERAKADQALREVLETLGLNL